MLIKLTSFGGEVPRIDDQSLPDNAAQATNNCDFSGPDLKGIKDATLVSVMPNLNGEPMVSVWTENGASFFAWPWEVDAVKNPVIDDYSKRICYTGLPATGPIIKQARTRRDTGVTVIANDTILGTGVPGSGNYKPPEASNPVADGGNGQGPDSWILGVRPPQVQDVGPDDLMTIEQVDRSFYPGVYGLRLRVTYFIENPEGEILWQTDISNNEAALNNNAVAYPQVFYTNDSANRGNLIQDMLWPLGYEPRPLKYYWFDPPPAGDMVLTRTVTITNNDLVGMIAITYGGNIQPDPEPGNPNGPPSGGGGDA
jgi:hypothetical protein